MMRSHRSTSNGAAITGVLVVAALLAASPALSHEAHRKPVRPVVDSMTAVAGERGSGHAEEHAPQRARPGTTPALETEAPPFELPPMGDMVVHHLHNKIIHVPLVLAPVALVLLLADRRRPGAGAFAPLFVWGAALSGIAAFFSGRAQAGAFDDGPKEWLVDVHQTWGLVVMATLLVWAVSVTWPAARRYAWIVGLLATIGTLVAGLYGGLVAHG